MLFKDFALSLQKLEKTSSRNKMTVILSELFKKSDLEEIDKICYLSLGRLAAKFTEIEFQMAEKMIVKAIALAFNMGESQVKNEFKKKGDLGEVVFTCLLNSSRKFISSRLSVLSVYGSLMKIAKEFGKGSVERKIKGLADLLNSLDPLSAKYVVRIPLGRLRLGFSDMTILDSLSWMLKGNKSIKEELERAYNVLPDVGLLAKKVKKSGFKKAIKNSRPIVGVPILPMLAQRLKSPSEMIKKMGRVAVEAKLDGLRIQIHFKKNKKTFVKAFTRNLIETSWMFPELKNIQKDIQASEIILDTEAVGLDKKRKVLVNFQTTMTRRRKHEIAKTAVSVPIKFYVFDILFKDGKNLMAKTYLKRREVLEKIIKKSSLFQVVDYKLTKSPKEISYLNEIFKNQGLEGILVKKIDSEYVPGRTGWRWVKMKEGEKSAGKLPDTLDCVIMGFSVGRGKRTQFGLGKFLVGIKDGENIKTITKVGTGLTDKALKSFKKRFESIKVKDKPKEYLVNKNQTPDYWLRPELIVEITGDDITRSPTHTSGFALRFPRLISFRQDKSPAQATTLKELKNLFKI